MFAFIIGMLTGAIQAGTSVLYAALGEVISERAGVINLGVEGGMLMGASTGFLVTQRTGNAWLGVLAAMLAGGVFNLLLAYLVVTRQANQLASGLALGFFGIGLSAFIGRPYVGQMIDGLPAVPVPGLADLPGIGRILFHHDLLTYAVVPVALLISWTLARTRWGLGLRAMGESKVVAYAAGLRPAQLQYQAIVLAGMLSGLGGAHLSLAFTGVWQEQMTAGRGFIAVALVIFAGWDPMRAVWGALLFGGALAFQLQLQVRDTPISPFFLDMLPYLLTLGVLLLLRKQRIHAMPAGLQTVFEGMK